VEAGVQTTVTYVVPLNGKKDKALRVATQNRFIRVSFLVFLGAEFNGRQFLGEALFCHQRGEHFDWDVLEAWNVGLGRTLCRDLWWDDVLMHGAVRLDPF